MKENIIKQMTQVVLDIMTGFEDDFYKYDMELLDNYDGKFLWFVAPTHAHLARIDEQHLHELMCKPSGERFIYALLQNNSTADVCLAVNTNDIVFYYDGDKMFQITHDEARHIWKAIKDFTFFQWTVRTGKPLPKSMRVPIKFNCSLSYVKEQLRFSAENGYNLLEKLKHFRSYMKLNSSHAIHIGRDFAEHSFTFASCYAEDGDTHCCLNGGLIFYGGKWSVHT